MSESTSTRYWGYSKRPKYWKQELEWNENDPQIRNWLIIELQTQNGEPKIKTQKVRASQKLETYRIQVFLINSLRS
jgi:hypothetical protein